MARPLRIEYPNAWYHVMNRGRRGENIFTQNSDHELFIALLKETSEMFDLRVSAYCLMPNHYHLLMQTPAANLSRAMRHINGVYTQRFNRAKNIDGPLFRGRYKSVLVEEDSHLLELLRYIHRNPVRAKMCRSVNEYVWTSHQAYVSVSKKWNWLHRGFILSLFADESDKARKSYKTFVGCKDSSIVIDFFGKKHIPSFFGSSHFVQWVKENYRTNQQYQEIPQSKQLAPTIPEILRIVSQVYGVKEKSLQNRVRGQINEPRNVAIYISRKRSGLHLHDIGKYFGLQKYSSVSSVVCRMEQQLSKNPQLRKQIEEICLELSKSQAKI